MRRESRHSRERPSAASRSVHSAAMSPSTPNARMQRQVETLIRVLAPPLDLLLAVGERVARVLAPEDPDYIPARMPLDGESAPRGLRGS
jgi:hypothetical protein